MASVKVTLMSVPTGTLMALSAGAIAITFGEAVSGDLVLNADERDDDSELPATSRICVVTSIVKVVLSASGLVGVNVAVRSPSLNAVLVGTATPAFVGLAAADEGRCG